MGDFNESMVAKTESGVVQPGFAQSSVSYADQLKREEIAAIDMVAAAQASRAKEDFMFRAESGVVLKLKRYSNRLLLQTVDQFTPPAIPKVEVVGQPGKYMDNEHDPVYAANVRTYNLARTQAVAKVQLGYGTDVFALPNDMEDANGIAWAEDIEEVTGLKMPPVGGKARYIMWLQYVALSELELTQLQARLTDIALGAVRQEDVEAAVASFPGVQGLDADTGSTAESLGDRRAHQDGAIGAGDSAGV